MDELAWSRTAAGRMATEGQPIHMHETVDRIADAPGAGTIELVIRGDDQDSTSCDNTCRMAAIADQAIVAALEK